ncbi:response regulator [Cohnella cellulosilytica]|uniref:Response regulator n=1 Tax=Cohnella cellulosilytica TaxID=986710 RepID=A0ABW2FJZ6_9BACL
MLKAMIVDDERATREKLMEYVDWSSLRIEAAGEAKDGAEGLRLFGVLRPDIVLMDVRMPRMNGIECAAEIRKLDPNCKIIFLSGYTDKHYLKSAIQMQAIDYIEKPIDLGELHDVLTKTAALCEEERGKLELAAVRVKQELALTMASDRADLPAIKKRFESIGFSVSLNDVFRCVLLEFGGRPIFEGEGGADVVQADRITDIVNREFENASLPCVSGMLDGSRLIVHICGGAAEQTARIKAAIEGVQQTFGCADAGGNGMVTAGIGKSVRGAENIRKSFELARGALQLGFIRGFGSINAEETERTAEEFAGIEDIRQNLKRCYQEENLAAAIREIDGWIAQLAERPGKFRISSVKAALLSVMLHLSALAEESALPISGEWKKQELLWAERLNRGTLRDAAAFIKELLQTLFRQTGQKGISRKIRAAIEYIREHYGEDLSVVAIADRLEMGSTYLSTLFKKETGQALSEFIEAYRMEKAKELLKDDRLKMSEVAGSVGYRNANYFATVFKRSTGLYPSEYRRMFAR